MANLNDIKLTDNIQNGLNIFKDSYFDGNDAMDYMLVDIRLEGSPADTFEGDDWVYKTCLLKDAIGHLQSAMDLVIDCHTLYIDFHDYKNMTFEHYFQSNDFDASNYKGQFEWVSNDPMDSDYGL